jgi:asparagine synthase (glutamine-hydrolysing)
MPGVHLIGDWRGGLAHARASITPALDTLLHDERYRATVLLDDGAWLLAHTGYSEYPIQSFDLGDVRIVLEGRIYGLTPERLAQRLRELATLAFQRDDRREARLREWLLASDGDYVAILLHRTSGELRILTDALGRLPLYCHVSGNGLIVSRELRLIARLMGRLVFDRLALANFLLTGYLLGRRTWLEGVERLPPATLLEVDPTAPRARRHTLHAFNFEHKPHADMDARENAERLAKLFLASCRARHRPGVDTVLSLSGGFDSRAVGAGLVRCGIPFRCATFLDHVGNASADVPIARRLAALFGVPWSLVCLGPPTSRDALKLLRMKNGLNPLGMAFLLPFLGRIRAESEAEVSYMTGEMGTFTLPDPRPARALASVREVAALLVRQYLKLSLPEVSALTGLDAADIQADLEDLIAAYPEQDLQQKYVHFIRSERALKWHSEAEDRNRCYFWDVTPFSSLAFFQHATGCPDDQKSSYGLYREFLLRLMPATAEIEHAGLGLPITSERFRSAARVAALAAAHPEWRARLGGAVGAPPTYRGDSPVLRDLRRQLATCGALAESISVPAAAAILEQAGHHTAEQLDHLFTVTSTIEDLATGASVLER